MQCVLHIFKNVHIVLYEKNAKEQLKFDLRFINRQLSSRMIKHVHCMVKSGRLSIVRPIR